MKWLCIPLTLATADVITNVDNVLAGEDAFLVCEASDIYGPVTSIFWTQQRPSDERPTWIANYKVDVDDGLIQLINTEVSNVNVYSDISNATSSSTLTLSNVQARDTDQFDFVCGISYENEARGYMLDTQFASTVRVNVYEQPSAPYFSMKNKHGNTAEYECRIDEMGYPTAPELSLTLVKADRTSQVLATGQNTVQSQVALEPSLNGGNIQCSVVHAANYLAGAKTIPDDNDFFVAPGKLHGEVIAVEYDHDTAGVGKTTMAIKADRTGAQPRSANEIIMTKEFTMPRVNNITNVCEVTVVASIPTSVNPTPDLKWYAKGQLQKTGGATYIHSSRNTDTDHQVTLKISSALGTPQYLTTNVKDECFPPQANVANVSTKAHGTLSLFLIIIIVIVVIVLVVIICVMARKRRAEKKNDEEQPKNEGELLSTTSPSDQTFDYQQAGNHEPLDSQLYAGNITGNEDPVFVPAPQVPVSRTASSQIAPGFQG